MSTSPRTPLPRTPLDTPALAQERADAALGTRQRADAIAAQRAAGRTSRKPAAERKQHRAKGLPDGWHALCVSIPRDQLEQLGRQARSAARGRAHRHEPQQADPDRAAAG